MSSSYTWCDVVQAIAAALGLIPLMVAGVIAVTRWWRGLRVEHLQFVEELSNKRRTDEVDNLFAFLETGWDENSLQFRKSVTGTLTFLSEVCSYLKTGKISKDEFAPYESDIRRLFANKNLKEYVSDLIYRERRESQWELLLKKTSEMGLGIDDENACADCAVGNDSARGEQEELQCANGRMEVKAEDFEKPTAIIKINRLYRKGMTDDEIQNTTSRWWRLNIESAKKIRLVLAVANGSVIGVYSTREQDWILDPGGSNRVGFNGCEASSEDRARFMGKSVQNLFPKGAANPVRYFGVK